MFHNNKFIYNNDDSIDYISNGDVVEIDEYVEGIDSSYYQKYLSFNRNRNFINVIFKYYSGKKKVMRFTKETTIKEMMKMFFYESQIPEKYKKSLSFTHSSNTIDINDISTLEMITKGTDFLINVDEIQNNKIIKGKQLKANIKYKKRKDFSYQTGTLEKIEDFSDGLKHNTVLCNEEPNIKGFLINGINIPKDSKKTFSSFGIRENFTCKIIYKDDNEEEYYKKKTEKKENKEKKENGSLCLII